LTVLSKILAINHNCEHLPMNTTRHDGVAFDKQKKKEKKDNDRGLAVLP